MRKNDLSVFKMEKEDFKLTLKKGTDFQPQISGVPPTIPPPVSVPSKDDPDHQKKEPVPLREITSPMVGSFYSAASPDAPAVRQCGR